MTRWITLLTGLYVLLGGLVSLAGWILDVRLLTDWDADGISIQPNATLCVMFSGVALLSLAANRLRLATVSGAVVLVIGGLTLFEWLTGLSLGIDALLLFGREWGRVGVVVPGRMGPPGSFCWTLIGVALVASGELSQLRRIVPAIALTTAAVSGLSLVGYLFGVAQLYALPYFTVIALQTSSFILAVSVGLLASHPEREPIRTVLDAGAAGVLARRALPLLLVVPVAIEFLRRKGEEAALYDSGMGSALVSLVLIGFLAGLMVWMLREVRSREQALLIARNAAEADARALDERGQRIRESEALFRTMGEAVPDFLWMTDGDGRPIYRNPAWHQYVGMSAEELAERGWEAAHHPDDVTVLQRVWAEAKARAEAFQVEVRMRRHDGVYRWFVGRTVPLKDDGGRPVRWVGTMTDVHSRKTAEDALSEANRRKDEFLATLAHELRNPLAPVRNAVQLLHMKEPPTPELQWARDVIDRQVQQMVRLIDDLMDVSRISRGTIELRRERVALSTVIQAAIETSRPLLDRSGHELTVQLPAQTLHIDADLTRLAQVFSNLLNNAAKYTERGGTIRLTVERTGSEVLISVKDSGIGIPQENLESIFQMFTQVNTSLDRSQGGLGIGLSLVKRFVEMHDGSVEAHSEGLEKGSEFVVRLPIIVESPDELAQGEVKPYVPAPSFRILIVDDNRDAADTSGMMLRSMGNDVRIAYDGEEAVTAAADFLPQIVLLDIGLPKLSGYEVCRRIRQEPWGRHMILIAVTGWGHDNDKRRAEAAGFDRHLVKPLDPRALIKLLGTLSASPARST